MTVHELIEKLKKMPPDAPVAYYDLDSQFGGVMTVREVLPPKNTVEPGSVVFK